MTVTLEMNLVMMLTTQLPPAQGNLMLHGMTPENEAANNKIVELNRRPRGRAGSGGSTKRTIHRFLPSLHGGLRFWTTDLHHLRL